MKKMQIGNKMYTVTSMNKYNECGEDLYNPRSTAIQRDNIVLPIKNISDDGPGIYYNGSSNMVCDVVKPSQEQSIYYDPVNIIDFSDAKTIKDVISKEELVRDIEKDILTTKENILDLKITDQDTPEMRGVKMAINKKQVDKKSYEDRFDQFQNDMRLLKGNKITLGKTIDICSKFDIGVKLTLYDISEDVANPMGESITIELTDRGNNK